MTTIRHGAPRRWPAVRRLRAVRQGVAGVVLFLAAVLVFVATSAHVVGAVPWGR